MMPSWIQSLNIALIILSNTVSPVKGAAIEGGFRKPENSPQKKERLRIKNTPCDQGITIFGSCPTQVDGGGESNEEPPQEEEDNREPSSPPHTPCSQGITIFGPCPTQTNEETVEDAIDEAPTCNPLDSSFNLQRQSNELIGFDRSKYLNKFNKQSSPEQKLPSYLELARHYPRGRVEEVKQRIGGRVNADWIENTCAIRMSRAFNYASEETLIEFVPPRSTISGDDGHWYYYRVNDFINHMKSNFGLPSVTAAGDGTLSTILPFQGKRGVIVFQVSTWSDATGHITLWNGNTCIVNDCYFEQATSVMLWETP